MVPHLRILISGFLFTVFCLPAWAQNLVHSDVESCLNRLNSFNQPGASGACEDEVPVYSATDEEQLRVRCLNVLCSDKLGKVAQIELKKSDLSLVTKAERQELSRLLAERYKSELQEELENMKMAKVLIEQEKPLSDPEEIRLANLLALTTQSQRVVMNASGVDEAATRLAAPDITGNELEAIKYWSIHFQQERKKWPAILTEDIGHLSQTMTSERMQKEVKAARVQYKKVFEGFVKDLKLPKSEFESDPIYSGALGQRLENGNFLNSDLIKFRTAFEGSAFFTWAWKDEKIQGFLSKDPIYLDPLLAGNKGKTLGRRIVHIERYLKNTENKSHNLSLRLLEIQNSCVQTVAYARQILPSAKALEEFRKKELDLRSEYIAGLSKRVSKSTAQELSKVAQTWQLALPPMATDFYQSLVQPLKDKLSEPDIKFDEKTKKMKFAIWLAEQGQFGNKPTYGRETENICEGQTVDLLPDHVELGSDKFSLGPVMGLDLGWIKGIAFHEYSHLVSDFMNGKKVSSESKRWYEKSRKCLSEIQPEVNHVEEDWSDMLSASLGTVNRRCYGISVLDSAEIVNSNPRDPRHSSDLFRALHHQFIQTGVVPSECKPLTFAGGKEIKIKNCL